MEAELFAWIQKESWVEVEKKKKKTCQLSAHPDHRHHICVFLELHTGVL